MMKSAYHYGMLYLALPFLSISCKSYQHKDGAQQYALHQAWSLDELLQRHYSLQRDSLSRHWYFSADGHFRFHPDSGLIGQGGKLFMQESRSNQRIEDSLTAEIQDKVLQTVHKATKNKERAVSFLNFALIAVLTLLLFLGWKFRKISHTHVH